MTNWKSYTGSDNKKDEVTHLVKDQQQSNLKVEWGKGLLKAHKLFQDAFLDRMRFEGRVDLKREFPDHYKNEMFWKTIIARGAMERLDKEEKLAEKRREYSRERLAYLLRKLGIWCIKWII